MRRFKVTIQGLPPGLLQHRYDPAGQMERTKTTAIAINRFELGGWRAAVYADASGQVIQPAVHLEQAVRTAATTVVMKGRKTWKDWISGNILIQPDEIPHEGVTLADLETAEQAEQTRRGNVILYPNGRVAITVMRANIGDKTIPRVRPLLFPWELSFELVTLDIPQECPEKDLKAVITNAGIFPGIGDFRPEKGGKYGKFQLEGFERVE